MMVAVFAEGSLCRHFLWNNAAVLQLKNKKGEFVHIPLAGSLHKYAVEDAFVF